MKRFLIAAPALLASLALAAQPGQAKQVARLRLAPMPGAWTYRYEAREITGDKVDGYNVDYRLKADRSGRITAVILKAETVDGNTVTPAKVDADCAKALGAKPGELAEIQLAPMTAERAKLGDAFMASCAPKAVFFPITDILNVTLIQASDAFHLASLKAPGDAADFDGFDTSFERLDMRFAETSDGGRVKLADVKDGRALVDWLPTPSRLTIVNGQVPKAVTLYGTEHFAFRLEIDANSGVLEKAYALYDDLDMKVRLLGVPDDSQPVVKLRRSVTIERVRR